ncbi:hypothetical protein [Pseudonocardia endophytica]|uniref:SAM-dependent MidA family methyltransferase n=1 Tax=Pseudonocardia endophytica TaxID=401976 RepID=A0A4R1HV25_PSEEN|nr:hypothetical protein [Pseudonocardia endophytica]TCK21312.1 hypothetical protein EV378_5293 [Pseudonocardia endophytica]
MLVDFRPHTRLRSQKTPITISDSLGPVVDALSESSTDLSRVRVVCDWVQYRQNFRDAVELRPIVSAGSGSVEPQPVPEGVRDDDLEIAIDVRRSADHSLRDLTHAALSAHADGGRDSGHVPLEDWRPTRDSCIWDFNALYWSALDLWEKATGQAYEQALPGGESDARNRDAARSLIDELFAVWDGLADGDALPPELYVVELGVGNGNQAKVFLDEFRERDGEHGRGYYRRLQYLMCDYSPHVLDLARETVADHAEHVSSFVLDATRPQSTLGFLQFKVFLVYISNVYDNLPTDEVAQLGGRTYLVESRAYLPRDEVTELAELVHARPDQIGELVQKLLRLGPALLAEARPEHLGGPDAAVEFWRRAWSAVRLEERYVALPGLDLYELAPTVSGEALRPLVESGADIRMHVNNGAVASFVETLPLLHPFGRLICHDIFVTDAGAYRTGFKGPGKYDGSVVNWVNGQLLAHVGRRRGFDVTYAPFAHRTGTNIITMTAQVRD